MDVFVHSDPKLLLYPPPKPKVRSIQLYRNDYRMLSVGTPINDVMIDFYLRYLHEETLTADQREQTYIFGSFFFNRFVSSGHNHVAGYTRKVNLFDKDFIVVPINREYQWLLAVICYPLGAVKETHLSDK